MRFLKIAGATLLILVLVITVAVWVYTVSLEPQYDGEIQTDELLGEVEVLYDRYGIPHIYADNAGDAYFALGYVHAQDRLFQMDLLRRVGSGRLSEFFGAATLEVDRLFHTLGLPDYAAASVAEFDNLPVELQTAVERYIDGINRYAADGPTPLEYTIGGLPREPFKKIDMYHIAGYMAFSFAHGLKTDPLVQHIAEELGPEYLEGLAVNHYPGQALAPSGSQPDKGPAFSSSVLSQLSKIAIPLFIGSNNWAVAGSRTKSGKPILANDTHIRFSQPSTWYEAHLEFPGVRLYGNFLAGIPLPLIGHTERLAWGLTMFENDDTDFYFETMHPEDSLKVAYRGNLWADVDVREVVIRVNGGEDDTLIVKTTPHGPIVNAFFEPEFDRPVAMYWTYTKKANQLPEAFFALSRAKRMEEARAAVAMIHAPGLNVAYADIDNNIALWSAAHLLQRPSHVNAKMILDGASGKDDPLGFYPFGANPIVENPPNGYVYSANSQHDTTVFGVMHPGYYTANVRMQRIRQLLGERTDWTITEMQSLPTDHYSKADAELAARFFRDISAADDEALSSFFAPLANWEGGHQTSDTVPTLYYELLIHTMARTFQDELGEEQYANYLKTHLMKRSNFLVFNSDSSIWFDDVNTDAIETRKEIVQRAAVAAKEALQERYGEHRIPEWGTVHTIEFRHPMGSVEPLDKVFNVGPFPMAGTNESVNQESFVYDTTGQYDVQHGPQMRILIDMADIENSLSVNPTGQSGNRLSDHYSDQAKLFVNGKYRPQHMNREAIVAESSERLLFVPRQ